MKNCDPNNDAPAGCMKQLARPYFLLDGVSEVPLSRYLGMKVGLPPICICCRRATDGPASGCAEVLCFECYELVRVRGSILRTNADPVVRGNFLPDNPTQFDYLHAIRAIATLHENAVLRGAMARLCCAVVCRMTPDEPTPEDRMELGEAWNQARGILENHSLPNYQSPK